MYLSKWILEVNYEANEVNYEVNYIIKTLAVQCMKIGRCACTL